MKPSVEINDENEKRKWLNVRKCNGIEGVFEEEKSNQKKY